MAGRHMIRLLRRTPSPLLSCRTPQLTCLALPRPSPLPHTCPMVTVARRTCSSGGGGGGFEVMNIQDEEDFHKRVLKSSVPVVVDFHAKWCGPCKLLGPRLESILSEKKGQIQMAKVDVDDHAELAIEFGVQSVPTVIALQDGQVKDKFIGLIEDDRITSFVSKLIPQS